MLSRRHRAGAGGPAKARGCTKYPRVEDDQPAGRLVVVVHGVVAVLNSYHRCAGGSGDSGIYAVVVIDIVVDNRSRRGHYVVAAAPISSTMALFSKHSGRAQRRGQRGSRDQHCDRKTSWLLHQETSFVQ